LGSRYTAVSSQIGIKGYSSGYWKKQNRNKKEETDIVPEKSQQDDKKAYNFVF
jgi:hypothetical protein